MSSSASPLAPKIHTYHCICLSLLLASTHTLSNLPRRNTTSGGLDEALILPVPSSPPEFSSLEGDDTGKQEGEEAEHGEVTGEEDGTTRTRSVRQRTSMPPEGYSVLLGMSVDRNIVVVRREDGFEKRLLHKCSHCKLVVGYEIQVPSSTEAMAVDVEDGGYDGKVVYLLPGGIMSTEVMAAGGKIGGTRIVEEDLDLKTSRRGKAIFE